MIPLCQCNLYVGVKCAGVRTGIFLYEFLCLRRMGEMLFDGKLLRSMELFESAYGLGMCF